ncbi:prolipoprotein diacylglyceryl transferase [Anaerococcus sp. AGMB00486]|uniref:Phosphatidylglycerol--prolipoprotein diacylglyceryl transferase n=2 Tax=Anaerococcus TaxID=165779 RepID=A0ABX2NBD5_9FIRM|nr:MULTISPECIES: prolipoprotein diacylglyceryl transferase [Anaerococcus]MDY3005510.1 prolipoprotein diacylglyceryl transferase [Anaerococcus porci]MSS78230.1 prolipoprotein diacylglyceryl transferase [Anaerococcus porci]NVF11988.1 prolipoprotein diacylglyceryl transferase [Anaerococcus faecalis]
MLDFKIDRVAFSIFGIDVYWYAIIIITGILIGAKFAQKEFSRRGFSEDFIYDILFVTLPFAIVGARLWYVVFEWDLYKNNPIEILNFRAGGLAIHGGILFAIIALYFYSKKKEIPLIDITDVMVPSLALGQAIGRWGNFVNGEAHGSATNLPWAILVDGVRVHPTFLYESIGDFLIFLFLINYRKKEPAKGKQTAIYFMAYGVLRFFVEALRTDSLMIGPIRMAQFTSVIYLILGIYLFVRYKHLNMGQFIKKNRC